MISSISHCRGPKRNNANAARLSKLDRQAGMVRLLRNILSEIRPENTVPTMPQTELTETSVLAVTML